MAEHDWVQSDDRYRGEGIGRVVLNHPDKRNALSRRMLEALDAALRSWADDAEVKVVLLAGVGPAFSAGHDLSELLHGSDGEVEAVFQTCSRVMGTIRHMDPVVIAEVEGVATAAGCQLVAAADLAVAGEQARFATPGVKIGYFCVTPAVFVSRNVSRKKAAEMLFTGEFLSAEEALAAGLVNRVVPAGEAASGALNLARQISRFSRETLARGKRDFYRQLAMAEFDALDFASRVMVENVDRPAAREGMAAFLERRQPVWPT
jgi:enoyl-CoA hydratase/carnithine racemase